MNDRVPSIGERLESMEKWLEVINDKIAMIYELMKRQAETDPMAILNAALKAEQERGR